jgi:hypothetical protein
MADEDRSHHCKNHTKPFQCPLCPARQATKRQHHRHVNECHSHTEKYYCTNSACKQSSAQNGKGFSREENCRKHMRRVHNMTSDQAQDCDMDEATRDIRVERKRKFGTGAQFMYQN